MELYFDNQPIEVAEGKTLQEVIRESGMDTDSLKTRPIAAMIGGEVYTLSYDPLPENHSNHIRRSIRAAKGQIHLLKYSEKEGALVYERSLLFIFCLAVRNLFPDAKVVVCYAVGNGVVARVDKEKPLSSEDTDRIRNEMRRIVEANYPFNRKRWATPDAEELFRQEGQMDKVRLCVWRTFPYFDLYELEGYHDYFYGEMVPSTSYISVFDLAFADGGIVIMRPNEADPDKASEYVASPKMAEAFRKKSEWAQQTHCAVIDDLNDMVRHRTIRDEIRISEARHEKQFTQVADQVVERGAKAVMIAGPSSSGKTTSANRLCVQLKMHAKNPILISLDNYYLDREKMTKEPDGTYDLESVYALDIELFKQNLKDLLEGKEVCIPTFDWKTKRPFFSDDNRIKLEENDVLVIEGLHGLNPLMKPDGIRKESIFRLYVSPLTTLNMDNHNRIRTTQIRQLRRMVRDFETRSTDIEKTLEMWDSVRRGEEKWIFPFQEEADYILDTGLPYEPFVLKRYVYPLLMTVEPDSPYYDEVRGIVKFLNYFLEANVEDEIPPTSILREFIGGNTFYK